MGTGMAAGSSWPDIEGKRQASDVNTRMLDIIRIRDFPNSFFIFYILEINYSMTELTDHTPLSIPEQLEGLLFVAPGPVTAQQLAATLDVPTREIEEALKTLKERLAISGGLELQEHKNRYQLTTKAGLSPIIERFLGLQATSKLSKAGVETLAIVAYKQPITRPQLDEIRGVNSDGVIKSLLSKGLIEEIGRTEGPGRPIIYGTTADFLQYFGLSSLEDLPVLDINPEGEVQEIQEKVFKD